MKKKRSGYTLVEAMVTATISSMVMLGSLSLYLQGSSDWAQGENAIAASDATRLGVRKIADELRDALAVQTDANGLGVTYQLPQKDANGNIVLPVTGDGLNRRIYYQSGNLYESDGVNAAYVVASHVVLYDPWLETTNDLNSLISTDGSSVGTVSSNNGNGNGSGNGNGNSNGNGNGNAYGHFKNETLSQLQNRNRYADDAMVPFFTDTVYQIFTPSTGSVTRSITMKLVTQNSGGLSTNVRSRIREVIYLRNAPISSQ